MAGRRRTTVCYFGEEVDLWDLATSAGLENKTVLKRWNRLGRPTDVTLIGELLGPPRNADLCPIKVDGVKTNIKRAALRFGVSTNTVRSRIEKHGPSLTSGQLRVNPNMQKHKKGAWPEGRPAQRVVEDKTVGWAERKYFPATGSDGFSKSARMGINAHCGRCSLIPLLGGD